MIQSSLSQRMHILFKYTFHNKVNNIYKLLGKISQVTFYNSNILLVFFK